jgi:hypothetical protein
MRKKTMKNKKTMNRILMGAISLALSASLLEANVSAVEFVSPETEIELTNASPVAKSIAVRLQGTEREEVVLNTLGSMVQGILQNAKLGIVRLPSSNGFSPANATKKLEILINVKSPLDKTKQPYKVKLTLQEVGTQGVPRSFKYRENDPDKTYQELKQFLTKHLDLQPKRKSVMPKTVQPPQSAYHPQPARQPILPPPVVENSQGFSSSDTEIQLKNMTPSVKSISIRLQGTEREKEVLDTVHGMVNDIFNESKLGIVRVPVAGTPMTTPAIKVYDHLEIVISAKSPEKKKQPYQVGITLQEKGEHGKTQYFNYKQDDWWFFLKKLKKYLTKELDLQPKR